MTDNECIECGKDIAYKRSDAKYCSDRCRMRYRRTQKKEKIIGELVELFIEMPNHSVQNTDNGLYLIGVNAFTRTPQKWDLSDLQNMSNKRLNELKKGKKAQFTGEFIAQAFSQKS
ncbi:DUF2116 family Zn-ribbon domain-containing protein [Halalkalibaculum sp. DA3122]|uniref:DUF2116 family Zn-ribbon domain-containing protein n=1 Tax=Halalkalibaculum sp. DA3122 TaxID=3373607 RepID=UPI003754E04C